MNPVTGIGVEIGWGRDKNENGSSLTNNKTSL